MSGFCHRVYFNPGSKVFSGVSEQKPVFGSTLALQNYYRTRFDLFTLSRFAFGRSFPGRRIHRATDRHRVVFSFLEKVYTKKKNISTDTRNSQNAFEMGLKQIKAALCRNILVTFGFFGILRDPHTSFFEAY